MYLAGVKVGTEHCLLVYPTPTVPAAQVALLRLKGTPTCRSPILNMSQVAITVVYRYQPPAAAPIDAGKVGADHGKKGLHVMGSPSSCPQTVAGALDPWSGTLDRSFGEVQQDLVLSCLTIGEAYCLVEVLQGIPHTR